MYPGRARHVTPSRVPDSLLNPATLDILICLGLNVNISITYLAHPRSIRVPWRSDRRIVGMDETPQCHAHEQVKLLRTPPLTVGDWNLG
jgi:hypothetical protein